MKSISSVGRYLVITKDDGTQHTVQVSGEVFLIGRGQECHLTLNDPLVSRQHAAIMLSDNAFFLVDMKSRNGTWVDGMNVKTRPHLLHDGETILVGNTSLAYIDNRAETSAVADEPVLPDERLEESAASRIGRVVLPKGRSSDQEEASTRQYRRIFISHAAEDDNYVTALASDLLRRGAYASWYDHQDNIYQQDWETGIEKAIEVCDCMILVFTDAVVGSKQVQSEFGLFYLENNKPIIPLKCTSRAIPSRLRHLHWVDFSQDYAMGFQHLLDALKNLFNELQ